MRNRISLAACLGLLFLNSNAFAHPHVWVTAQANMRFQNEALTRISMYWQFDAFFSQVLQGDFDTNKDGKFDGDETAAMKNQVFTSLRDYGYFTHLRVNKTEVTFDRVDNFSVSFDKGEMIYVFDLVLATPLDLMAKEVTFSVYDPSIYVDIILGGDKPLVMDGMDPTKCRWTFGSGNDITNENGSISTQVAKLVCKAP